MYKININSGLGDCLRRLHECRVVALCSKENKKCLVSYQDRLKDSWRAENAKIFATLIDKIPCLEYVEDYDVFLNQPGLFIEPTNPSLEKLPLFKIEILSDLPKEFISTEYNVALHVKGSTDYKKINDDTLRSVCDFLSAKKATVYIIDHPGNYDRNKQFFSNYPTVKVIKNNFVDSCKLIQACDLLIAPDSYSKYLDLYKKMLIMCTSVPYMTTEFMFSYAFKQLLNNSTLKIVGQTPGMSDGTITSVCQISPKETLKALEELIAK